VIQITRVIAMQQFIVTLLLTKLVATITSLPIRADIKRNSFHQKGNTSEQTTSKGKAETQRVARRAECNSEYVIVSTPRGGPLNARGSNSKGNNTVMLFPNNTIYQDLGSDNSGQWTKVKAGPVSEASSRTLVAWVWSDYVKCLSDKALALSRNERIKEARESAEKIFQQMGGYCSPAASTLLVNCDSPKYGSWVLTNKCIGGSRYDANGNGMERACTGKFFYKFSPESDNLGY
jgi:hypothetical protein